MQEARARGQPIGECLGLWGGPEAPGGSAEVRARNLAARDAGAPASGKGRCAQPCTCPCSTLPGSMALAQAHTKKKGCATTLAQICMHLILAPVPEACPDKAGHGCILDMLVMCLSLLNLSLSLNVREDCNCNPCCHVSAAPSGGWLSLTFAKPWQNWPVICPAGRARLPCRKLSGMRLMRRAAATWAPALVPLAGQAPEVG